MTARVAIMPEDIYSYLTDASIDFVAHSHPSVYTAREQTSIVDDLPGLHLKSLFLKDKKSRLFMITTPFDAVINLKTLHKKISSGRLSFAKEELLDQVLGVKPGSVSPLALVNDAEHAVTLVLDGTIADHGIVYAHPLLNDTSVELTQAAFQKFLRRAGVSVLEIDIQPSDIQPSDTFNSN